MEKWENGHRGTGEGTGGTRDCRLRKQEKIDPRFHGGDIWGLEWQFTVLTVISE